MRSLIGKIPVRGKIFFLILFPVLFVNSLTAQNHVRKYTITGSAVDADLYPVANAIILIDGQQTKAITNPDGKYRVKVNPMARKISVISFMHGMIEEEIAGRKRVNFGFRNKISVINPEIQSDIQLNEEGVNTGYGYTKKKYLANNIKRINAKEKRFASYRSVEEMLEREVSGIKIVGGEVVIYNSSNLLGYVPALIVIDGVPSEGFEGLKPPMVESIEVLKDASAAIYGTRGYGGAVLITTKK